MLHIIKWKPEKTLRHVKHVIKEITRRERTPSIPGNRMRATLWPSSMVPPGQLGVPVCSSAYLSYFLSPPPVFAPFCPIYSLFFVFLSVAFVPLCVSVCLYVRFCFFAFCYLLLSGFLGGLASLHVRFLVVRLLVSFCFPGVLSGGMPINQCFFFCFCLCFTTEVFLPLQRFWSLFCDHDLHSIVATS